MVIVNPGTDPHITLALDTVTGCYHTVSLVACCVLNEDTGERYKLGELMQMDLPSLSDFTGQGTIWFKKNDKEQVIARTGRFKLVLAEKAAEFLKKTGA